ncbi:MAG TPA: nitroreductase family protein [Aggregatilineales bacterium]|nr:nitroreductase family protein [Aggregatilineales bacterium]
MDANKAIRTKRAVRQFSNREVSREDILSILDSGRRAQSSKNSQPWYFIVVQDRAKLKALSETGNFAQHLAGATFAVVFVSQDNTPWINFDLGQSAAYMQLAAWTMGIGSCLANIYRPDDARHILGIPPELNCMVAISFGYPAAEPAPAKRGGRKPLEDLVRWDQW